MMSLPDDPSSDTCQPALVRRAKFSREEADAAGEADGRSSLGEHRRAPDLCLMNFEAPESLVKVELKFRMKKKKLSWTCLHTCSIECGEEVATGATVSAPLRKEITLRVG